MTTTEGYTKLALSGLLGAALGITVAYSTGVADNRTAIAVMTSKIETLNETISAAMSDRYKGADAARDLGVIHNELREIRESDKEISDDLKTHLRTTHIRDGNG